MATDDFLTQLISGVGDAVDPLVSSLNSKEKFAAFLKELGWVWDQKGDFNAIQNAFSHIQDALTALRNAVSNDDTGSLMTAAVDVTAAVADLAKVDCTALPTPLDQSAFWNSFPDDVLEFLIYRYFNQHQPFLFGLLSFVGVLKIEAQGADATTGRQAYNRQGVDWGRIPQSIAAPQDILKDVYGWGGAFKHKEFMLNLGAMLAGLHTAAKIYPANDRLLDSYYDPDNASRLETQMLVASLFQLDSQTDDLEKIIKAVLVALPVPPKGDRQGAPEGLMFFPHLIGDAAATIPLATGVDLTIGGGFDTEILRALVRPSGVDIELPPLDAVTLQAKAGVHVNLAPPCRIFGGDQSSRLEFSEAHVALGLAGPVTDLEYTIEAALDQLNLIIDFSQSDSFLKTIFGSDPQGVGLNFGVSWSNKTGLKFLGKPGLEIDLPVRLNLLNVIKIDTLYLSAQADLQKQTTEASIALSAGFKLGPISASVEKIGVKLDVVAVDKDHPGNLGTLNLDFGFKPPVGLALSVSASVVKGGGYLMFDPDKGEYAGALELNIQSKFIFTAIGILTTKFPDGTQGYSLLIIICAQFPPITLGFGFFLNGLGGLVGLNRTMDVDVMREGVKQGTVDDILFPTNIIENIIKIISDIKAIFPVAKEQFVVGPMALITWGPQPILSVKLGIVIELSNPFRLNILGVLKVALPQSINPPLIQIQVNFFGSLDFQKGTLTFDASLFDSFIGTSGFKFTLEGDMALRIFWGEEKEFLLSVGGFHPAFHPAANLKVANMKRLTLNLLTGNPHLTLTTYFALTSNTVQFGAEIDFYFSISSFSVEGYFGFDVLFQFSPFHLIADIEARLSVKCGDCDLFSVGLAFELDGPSPWHAKGKAKFKVWFISYTAHFDKTFGEDKDATVPLVAVLPPLLEALNTDGAWQGEIPEGSFTTVSVRKVEEDAGILLHGHGVLTIRQNVMPLGTKISRFGANPPADIREAEIAEVRLGHEAQGDGTIGKKLNLTAVQDLFAPGNFKAMSDDDKLKAPSFEQMDSGVRAEGTDGVSVTYGLNRPVDYEVMISDEDPAPDGTVASKPVSQGLVGMPKARFAPFVGGGAIGQSALSKANVLRRLALDNKRVKVGAEEFAVVFKENLQKYPGSFVQGTRDEADRDLQAAEKTAPGLAGRLQMVPAYQATA